MKGGVVIIVVFFVIAFILGYFLIDRFLSTAEDVYVERTPEVLKHLAEDTFYDFDEELLLEDVSNSEEFFRSELCDSVKRCIVSNMNNEEPCTVADFNISFDSYDDPDADYILSSLRNCVSGDLYTEVGEAEQKVCYFDANSIIGYSSLDESSANYTTVRTYNNPFVLLEPHIHGCQIPKNFRTIKEGIEQDFNNNGWISFLKYNYSNPVTFGFEDNRMFFYAPYWYLDEFKYSYLGGGGGSMKIILTDGYVGDDSSRTCGYNLFVCGQPWVAQSEADKTVRIFNDFRYFPEERLECPVQTLAELVQKGATHVIPGNYLGVDCGIYPRSYVIDFEDGERHPNVREIENAIATGLWEWNKLHFKDRSIIKQFPYPYNASEYIFFSFEPWKTSDTPGLTDLSDLNGETKFSYDTDCLNSSLLLQNFYDLKPTVWYGEHFWSDFEDTNYNSIKIKPILFYNFNQRAKYIEIIPRITICMKK